MSDRYLPFSSDDLERDMQDRQNCRVCGRACSSTVGVCRSPVCTSALVEKLEQQLAELREAVLAYVGPVDDPHIGWRGSSPSHNDLFQCEACGAEDADTRAMQHTDNCTAAALLATIGQKP